MSKPKKVKGQEGDILTRVVSTASIASQGVANGRNIPVVFVEADLEGKIEDIIIAHKLIKNGSCTSQWGVTEDNEYAVLFLDFGAPVEQKVILFFDIVKQGFIVDQILYAKCLYLMTGEKGTRLSQHLDDPRVLIEVLGVGFEDDWDKAYKKRYAEHLRRKHHFSKKESLKIFDEIRNEMQKIQTLRMK